MVTDVRPLNSDEKLFGGGAGNLHMGVKVADGSNWQSQAPTYLHADDCEALSAVDWEETWD